MNEKTLANVLIVCLAVFFGGVFVASCAAMVWGASLATAIPAGFAAIAFIVAMVTEIFFDREGLFRTALRRLFSRRSIASK